MFKKFNEYLNSLGTRKVAMAITLFSILWLTGIGAVAYKKWDAIGVNFIYEKKAGHGVIIDGVTIKDNSVDAPTSFKIGGTNIKDVIETLTNKTISGASNTFSNIPASAIGSGTVVHERGGLEADVSGYSGLLKIAGGATSAVTAPTGTIVGTSDSQILTNKTIDGDDNTVQDIPATAIADGSVSNAEFEYLANVTGDIQQQLDSKEGTTSNLTERIISNNYRTSALNTSNDGESVVFYKPETAGFADTVLDGYSGNLGAVWKFSNGELLVSEIVTDTLTDSNSVTNSSDGKSGYSAEFSGGLQENLSMADNTDLSPTTSMAVSMWVNLDNITYDSPLLFKDDSFSCEYDGSNGGTDYKLRFKITESDSGTADLQSAETISQATWVHLVFIADATAGYIYIYENGSSVGTPVAYDGTIKDNANIVYMGFYSDPIPAYLAGHLDEVYYWKNPSFTDGTARELFVTKLYNSGNGTFYTSYTATADYRITSSPRNDGWQRLFISPTCSDASDTHSAPMVFAGIDYTSYLDTGNYYKMTQDGITKYGIITAVSFSTNTTIEGYSGSSETYDITTSAISNFYYSKITKPQGFPRDPDEWSESLSDASETQSPSATTWYNISNLRLDLPPGKWRLTAKTDLYCQDATSAVEDMAVSFCIDDASLAGTSDAPSYNKLYTSMRFLVEHAATSGDLQICWPVFLQKNISILTATSFYTYVRTPLHDNYDNIYLYRTEYVAISDYY